MRLGGEIKLIYLLMLLLAGYGCSTLSKLDAQLSHTARFLSPYEFIYFPATLELFTGDTIKGRFTNVSGTFYMIHENKDSNVHKVKPVYPVSDYYKIFRAEELKKYTVNNQTYESTILVNDKSGFASSWVSSNITFMKRLTADSSLLQLYLYYAPYTRNEKNNILVDMLFPADTSFGLREFDINYCIHFPGEGSHTVWNLGMSHLNKQVKTKFVELFLPCPELYPTAEKIKQSSANHSLVQSVLDKTDYTKQRIAPALINIISKYNDCYYSNAR